MTFEDSLSLLASRVVTNWEQTETEEATKTAFILPFISTVLGYDIFDPQEVIPEYTADIGVKRGEKVDYAIMGAGTVRMLIECKKISGDLTPSHAGQLFRYFSVTNARIAILTNGRQYNFYTDLEQPNKMDEKPFLVLDLADIDETLLPELRKLTKDQFDLDSIMSAAEELKYVGAIKREITAEFREPSSDFIRLFASRVYSGRLTQPALEKFVPLTSKAMNQFLAERVNDRLKNALGADSNTVIPSAMTSSFEIATEPEPNEAPTRASSDIETTEDELAAFYIVKAIACAELPPERIAWRDAKSYFSVLVDDNNRRPILRCYFNGRNKYLVFLDDDKNETRVDISVVEDIYLHVDAIREAARRWQ